MSLFSSCHVAVLVMSCHVMSCHVMSCHVMSCHVMSCHVMSCHVMSRHVMSCHVTRAVCPLRTKLTYFDVYVQAVSQRTDAWCERSIQPMNLRSSPLDQLMFPSPGGGNQFSTHPPRSCVILCLTFPSPNRGVILLIHRRPQATPRFTTRLAEAC